MEGLKWGETGVRSCYNDPEQRLSSGATVPQEGHLVCTCMHAQSCTTLCDLTDHSPPAPPSMGFPRQEYWSRLPSPPPGDLPDPGFEPVSLLSLTLQGRFFNNCATWEAPAGGYFSIQLVEARVAAK